LTGRQWTTVRVRSISNRAAVISALFSAGAEGVQELDDEVLTQIRDAEEPRVLAAVGGADSGASVTFAPTPDVDWSAEWRKRITAHRLGALVVTPPWLADLYSRSERIVIEPAMAFGTGEHETTRSVIRLLQRAVRAGDMVADLGAGSAVLSIAAAKLGASRVVAIELDPDALGNAAENVDRNAVADRVAILEGDAAVLLPLIAPVRVVMANIISAALLELLPVIADSLVADGVAILSGILVDEAAEMQAALARDGWITLDTEQEGLWWSVSIARP
jgi:ribosomal protein L11 methyltransferase